MAKDKGPFFRVHEILKGSGSGYALSLFSPKEQSALELFDQKGKPYLTCAATGKARSAKPEEIVRQLFLRRLMGEYGYPVERIAVEKGVYFGSTMAENRPSYLEQKPRLWRITPKKDLKPDEYGIYTELGTLCGFAVDKGEKAKKKA